MNNTKFYTFRQNNSGGSFHFVENKLTHFVIIEAQSARVARAIAEDLGIYFNGCNDGRDCRCCGDRWYLPYGNSIDDQPTIYGKSPQDYEPYDWEDFRGKPQVYIHYLDGRVVGLCRY